MTNRRTDETARERVFRKNSLQWRAMFCSDDKLYRESRKRLNEENKYVPYEKR